MVKKNSAAIGGALVLVLFGLFLLKSRKDMSKTTINKVETPIIKVETPIKKAVKFFERETTKLGLDVGLTPAQIFSIERRGFAE